MSKPPSNESPLEPSSRNDRATYRAAYPSGYPVALIPHIHLKGERMALPILDCSEEGIRYRAPVGAPELPLGTPVAGELHTRNGTATAIRGHIVRAEAGDVAMRLNAPGLPFSMLLAEQRAVIQWTRTRAEQGG